MYLLNQIENGKYTPILYIRSLGCKFHFSIYTILASTKKKQVYSGYADEWKNTKKNRWHYLLQPKVFAVWILVAFSS